MLVAEKKPKKVNKEIVTAKLIIGALFQGIVTNWPKEIKIAKKIGQMFPDPNFWQKAKDNNELTKYPTLSWALTKENSYYIAEKYQEYVKSQPKDIGETAISHAILPEKLGEDTYTPKVPKSVMDFLNK